LYSKQPNPTLLCRDGDIVWNQEIGGGAVNDNPTAPMYITEGTNDHPNSKIRVQVESISSIGGSEIDQEWLESNSEETDQISAGTDPFQNFKIGDRNTNPRHPLEEADDNYG